jgi:hypothetical protein
MCIRAHLEILRFTGAKPVLQHLREGTGGKLQRDDRHGIRVVVAHTAR